MVTAVAGITEFIGGTTTWFGSVFTWLVDPSRLIYVIMGLAMIIISVAFRYVRSITRG